MHLAQNSLFISVARILWAFDILPALGADGKPIIPDPWNFTDGFNSKPVSFRCRIKARSASVEERIESEWRGALVITSELLDDITHPVRNTHTKTDSEFRVSRAGELLAPDSSEAQAYSSES
ncbi:hypothetical protein NUW54_g5177 [Trametes sanguinea]|uniref:Uncharacterized protein n=1 Tax=Trametes sanguinea TaxID=158606 RepID=A0ACC1PXF9_9APHY|nr:hypothetical protein NUW54_g5177 [Trametes sanguinea]